MKTSELGERVRALRMAKNWRQQDLASRVARSVSTISEIELSQRLPGAELVRALDTVLEANGELISLLRELRVPRAAAAADSIRVTAHLFYPAFVDRTPSLDDPRRDAFKSVHHHAEPTHDIHVYDFGVAVIHERHDIVVSSLAELASWRVSQIDRRTTAASEHLAAQRLPAVLSPDPYCFAVFETHQGPWEGSTRRSRAAQVMSCLSLLSRSPDPTDQESLLLSSGEAINDAVSFGLPLSHHGWASWAGVAVDCDLSSSEYIIVNLVEFEILVQAIWCYSDHIATTGTAPFPQYGERFLRDVRRELLHLAGTEPTSRRLLREAIIKTSRIREQIEAALDALV